MKSYVMGVVFLFSGILFAQENVRPVVEPIYFGCEKETTNEGRSRCMSKSLGDNIAYEIEFFTNIADYLHITSAASKLTFSINEEGRFSDVDIQGSNPIFNSFIKSSLVMIQSKIIKANLKIEPGKDKNNKSISVAMALPVRFKTEIDPKAYNDFPSENRVLFTIATDEEDIEIRMDKNYALSTYGDNGRFSYFLGKYNNLFELAFVEPYASAIESSFKSGYTSLTKGEVDGKEYMIRLKNFFSTNPNDQFLIEVIREENNQWIEYYEFKSKIEFNASRFAKLTYRK